MRKIAFAAAILLSVVVIAKEDVENQNQNFEWW